jgi:CheY-like chemotaxis protein
LSGTVLIVSPDAGVANLLRRTLAGCGDVIVFSRLQSAFDLIYNEIPNLLILDLSAASNTVDPLRMLKEDPLFAGLPVLAILDERNPLPDWATVMVDDYIWKRDLEGDIAGRVQLCFLRSQRVVEVNPLTRLPGNISINREIQIRLDRKEAFAPTKLPPSHWPVMTGFIGSGIPVLPVSHHFRRKPQASRGPIHFSSFQCWYECHRWLSCRRERVRCGWPQE